MCMADGHTVKIDAPFGLEFASLHLPVRIFVHNARGRRYFFTQVGP